jgi:hypothetical protein
MKDTIPAVSILCALFFCGASFSIAHAQSGSFIVKPAKVELTGAPGETVEASISLENQLGIPATFTISFEDVAGSDNPNDPVTLLGVKRGPYPLRDLLHGPKAVTLLDKAEKRIPISITIPPDASPGGLYGSVIFTPERKKVDGNVVPNSRIGVLFFLRVEGDAREEGSLKDFSYEGGRVVFGTPSKTSVATLLFENTGTVHLSPYGILTAKSLFGESREIPIDPWYVLPKSARSRALPVGEYLSYGPQTLSLVLHRGYGEKTDTRSLTVWVFPSLRTIGIIFAVLAVLLVFIFRRGRRLHVV